ncbi:MAG: carbon starvation protein A, partial [Deltaproteobacteria bacterium]|nr:carbon starvation protein A [Deltaproteobacteria bacterium]
MELLAFVLLPLAAYLVAYHTYGRFISRRILGLDPGRRTPAIELQDGVDYVPANRFVLMGHHFASIAGLGPIIGPAIAVVWGWLPALLWVVFGSILMGAVHDLTTLTLSLRHQGRSVGDITRDVLGPRARLLFLLVVFFLLALAMGVFAQVVGKLFAGVQPGAVIPAFGLMAVAMGAGLAMVRFRVGLLPVTLAGL